MSPDTSNSKEPNRTMSESAHPHEGQMIEGRYRIIRKIAEGGMATVYQAMDMRLERTVAIKIMHTQLAQGPHRAQFVERFRREAKSAAAIANPHIVQVYDTGEVDGLDYLVMEFVHGVNLRREMNEQGPFSVRETLRIVAETLDGLASAHRAGVVHRDIKPENILLNDRGHVQITDFGLAKAASQATLSSTGMLLGTAAYLAPEMIEYNQATPQGDLYSVGIMAWEMLAGEVPFVSDNPVTLVFKHVHEDVPSIAVPCPGIDPGVAKFIAHLTARKVEDRPADAVAASNELLDLTSTLAIPSWTYRRPRTQGDDDGTIAVPVRPAADRPITNQPSADRPTDDTHASATDNDDHATVALSSNERTLTDPPAPPTVDAASATPASHESSDAGIHADTGATQIFDDIELETSPTKTFPAPSGDAAHADDATGHHDDAALPAATDTPQPAKRPRRPRTPLVIAIVVLLLAVAGAIGGATWWQNFGPGSYWTVPQPGDVSCTQGKVCSVTGAKWSDYERLLHDAQIRYTSSDEYSDTVAAGAIISAEPSDVGTRISKRDGTMTIVVSKGVKTATVPSDILDATSSNGKDALAALTAAGFDNIQHDAANDQYDETLPAGAAISITDESGNVVEPGLQLKHNAKITVVLSKGPMPVTMPDIVGKTQSEMETALEELRLTANVTEAYDDKVKAGSVVSASQDAGTQLHWGDSVDVVVSKGPETATIPSGLVGKQESDVTKQLEKLGFKVKTERVLGGLFGTVRSIKNGNDDVSDGGSVRLRDTDGNPTVITLTIV